jgi:hypothetical protein
MHETYDEEARLGREPATGPRLGIIGGGQLARMTTIAAQQLGWWTIRSSKWTCSPPPSRLPVAK